MLLLWTWGHCCWLVQNMWVQWSLTSDLWPAPASPVWSRLSVSRQMKSCFILQGWGFDSSDSSSPRWVFLQVVVWLLHLQRAAAIHHIKDGWIKTKSRRAGLGELLTLKSPLPPLHSSLATSCPGWSRLFGPPRMSVLNQADIMYVPVTGLISPADSLPL